MVFQDEIGQQDELVGKQNKEKKHQDEVNNKLMDDLQAEETKVAHLNKVKAKLEHTLDEVNECQLNSWYHTYVLLW